MDGTPGDQELQAGPEALFTPGGLHRATLERIYRALDQRYQGLIAWNVRYVYPPRVELGAMDGWLAHLEEMIRAIRSEPDARFPPAPSLSPRTEDEPAG